MRLTSYLDLGENVMLHFLRLLPKSLSYTSLFQGQRLKNYLCACPKVLVNCFAKLQLCKDYWGYCDNVI